MADEKQVLWSIRRDEPLPYAVEMVVSAGGEYWYEAAEREDDIDDEAALLRAGPFVDAASVASAYPETFSLRYDDEVTLNEMPVEVVSQYLEADEDEVEVAGDLWVCAGGGTALPEDLEAIGSWSNDDRYGSPGADRSSELFALGSRYVARDDSGVVEVVCSSVGRDEAIRLWIEGFVAADLKGVADLAASVGAGDVDRLVDVLDTELDAVCVLEGQALYDAQAFAGWWEEDGHSEFDDAGGS